MLGECGSTVNCDDLWETIHEKGKTVIDLITCCFYDKIVLNATWKHRR